MFCATCGAALPAGANFCPNCGVPTGGAPRPTPPAAPVVEGCVVALRWQAGSGFVPAWFEANASGPAGAYNAGQSPAFNVIPGDPFWLNTQEVRDAHAGLVNGLTSAGWQVIGRSSTDWWGTELRRHV